MAEVLERTDTTLRVARPASFDDLREGASIGVSGACLSITSFDESSMSFAVVQETWDRTMLGDVAKGDLVNLERAMKADGRFDGHIVQGHVDSVGEVKKVAIDQQTIRHAEQGPARSFDSAPHTRDSAQDDESGAAEKHVAPATLTISYPSSLKGLIVEKGSIAISGVSLTITKVDDVNFSVALIPLTLSETTLGGLKEGDKVNLEADILAKYAKA